MGPPKTKSSWAGGLELFSGTPLIKSIEADDFENWKSQILFSLHQMEDPTQPLILWDIIVALYSLKPVTNAGLNLRDTDTLYAYLDNLHASLASASCRQLQIFCVVYRQLLLAHCRAEILSGRISLEQLDAPGERTLSLGKISGHFLHSAEQEDLLKKHLSSVEHELRQRLYLGTLSLASCLESAEQLENRLGDMEVVTPLIVNWVIANKSDCFPHLVQLADEMSSTSNDM
jgi:hypothetical protein